MPKTAKGSFYDIVKTVLPSLLAIFIFAAIIPTASNAAPGLNRWAVNVKSFLVAEEARSAAEAFNKAGYNAYVTQADVRGRHYYRLRIGFYSTSKEALAAVVGMDAIYKTEDPWAVKVSIGEARDNAVASNRTKGKKTATAEAAPVVTPEATRPEPTTPKPAPETVASKPQPEPAAAAKDAPAPATVSKSAPEPAATTVIPGAGPEPVGVSADGSLHINIYKDFIYVPSGWPMGLSVGQTDAAGLKTTPLEILKREPAYSSPKPLYGYMRLGNSDDPLVSFVLDKVESRQWELYLDKNNNEDMTDDGPPIENQGTLKMAATVELDVDTVLPDGKTVKAPYKLWFFINTSGAHFYATCHYKGKVRIKEAVYDAVAFEEFYHDGLFKESGVCIDLNRDAKCSREQEAFKDGESLIENGKRYTFRLDYP
ncbi:MAG: SPOR domain-containing protein [Deltaproteobacteria bacterium]|nr:SPOR domain-containing protein [Deltaproteobacteria bacterium]